MEKGGGNEDYEVLGLEAEEE
ncbi:hypothetical protein A2U01_0064427, partial [Trifolium medium]|nr:hypothetical protein [Trifolium medium]